MTSGSLPVVSAKQMREVDRIMVENLGITLLQMMENAGRNLADFVQQRHHPTSVVVLAGGGGNGGGGMVAARHLSNRGVNVTAVLSKPADALVGAAATQLGILQAMEVAVSTDFPADYAPADHVVIDSLVGYSLRGAPSGRTAELIAWANGQNSPVISLDVPSGLDSTTGETPGAVVTAEATLTIAAPKTGLRDASSAGEVYLTDISVPTAVWRQLGFDVATLFVDGPLRKWELASK